MSSPAKDITAELWTWIQARCPAVANEPKYFAKDDTKYGPEYPHQISYAQYSKLIKDAPTITRMAGTTTLNFVCKQAERKGTGARKFQCNVQLFGPANKYMVLGCNFHFNLPQPSKDQEKLIKNY